MDENFTFPHDYKSKLTEQTGQAHQFIDISSHHIGGLLTGIVLRDQRGKH